VAARLEQSAGSGEILLGDQTVHLVQDAALVEPVDELALKGKAQPVSAWRLLSVPPDTPAFTLPYATPFVGREQELGPLAAVFERTVAEQRCQLVTVPGQPGIGKSRLMREAVVAVGDDARVLVGRCLLYPCARGGRGQPALRRAVACDADPRRRRRRRAGGAADAASASRRPHRPARAGRGRMQSMGKVVRCSFRGGRGTESARQASRRSPPLSMKPHGSLCVETVRLGVLACSSRAT
jgi:hypothetical protein